MFSVRFPLNPRGENPPSILSRGTHFIPPELEEESLFGEVDFGFWGSEQLKAMAGA